MNSRCAPWVLWVALLLTVPTWARGGDLPRVPAVRIAADRGDYGLPNPFHHYPRGSGYVRMSWVFDTLLWKGREGIVPALARSWSYDPGVQQFTFHLNPRARWHDGRPVTAADVAFTFAYLRQHPYPWVSLDAVERAEALDDHTVVVHLARPYAPFLAEVGGVMPILPRHVWEGVEDPRAFTGPEAFVGSGPYRFRDFDRVRGAYLYQAFEAYYRGRPRAQRLIYLRSANPLGSLTGGQADLAAIQPEMAEPLRRQGFAVIEDEWSWVRKLMINHSRFPLDQAAFRRALARAIDRKELVAQSQRGFAAPASLGLLSVDHPWYNPDTPDYAHDLARARAEIAALGYQAGADGFFHRDGRPLELELLTTSLTVAGSAGGERDGPLLKRQLEAAGIRVRLTALELATADSRVRAGAYDLALSGHGGVCGDPKILNEMVLSRYGAGSVNSARFDVDPVLTELLEAQLAEMDPARRRDWVYRIQERLAQVLPSIPLYYPAALAAYHPGKGIAWFYTPGEIAKGVPIPQNKLSLVP